MSDTYNDEESMQGTTLEKEYDASFDGDEKMNMLMKLSSSSFNLSVQKIKIAEIAATVPKKKSRVKTMIGLSGTIKDMGVVVPIHVMTISDESEDDDYKYVLIDGLRRMYGAMRNGQEEISAVVWDFEDKDKGSDLALFLSMFLNRNQRYDWSEIWDLYKAIELSSEVTPGTIEYLLQLEAGDAMKLKDVMTCNYEEVTSALLNGEKDLAGAYKLLQKLRKEENKLQMEDEMGLSDTVEEAEEMKSNNVGDKGELSDQDVMELLEMTEDLDSINEVGEDDFADMNKVADDFVDKQQVGDRHPIDPALRQAVLARDDFKCACCELRMVGARMSMIAVHHKIPVHCSGKDTMDNLVTLCVGCHITLHVIERNGGSIMMDKADFDELPERDQVSLKRALKLARIAVEADKRRGLSKDQVREATQDSLRHPMPGISKENEMAYAVTKRHASESNSTPANEDVAEEEDAE